MSVNFYKKMKVAILIMVSIFISSSLYAQLSGVKTIDPAGSGPNNYTSFASAVLDLNAVGVGTGGVTFNVAAGATFTELAAITLTTTTSDASKPIIFQASGSGNAPIVRAVTGTTSITTFGNNADAVIKILSTDYVTFDGIEFRSNATATTNAALAEYGIMLVKTPTDACKNITIKNCRFNLGKTNAYSIAIYQSNLGATGNTAITVTSVGGRSENNVYIGNTISNTYHGIYVNGFAHSAAPYNLLDHHITIGANGAGNSISEYGGSSVSPYAIYTNNTDSAHIRYNTVSGLDGTTTTGYGIYAGTATNGNVFITRNSITFTKLNSSTSTNYAIYVATGSSGVDNLILIDTNTVANSTFVGNASLYGVYAFPSAKTVKIRRNIVSNNMINGTFYGLYPSTSSTVTNLELSYNTIRDNYRTVTSTSSVIPVYISSTLTNDIHHNYISNNRTIIGSSTVYGIYNFGGSVTNNIYNNTIDSVGTISVSGSNYGIYSSHSATSNTNIYNNIIRNVKASGSSTAHMIYNTGGDTVKIYNNKISGVSVDTARALDVSGIYLTSSSGDVMVYNNYISEISSLNGFGANAIKGIFAGSIQAKIYNNTIFLNANSSTTNASGFGSTGIEIATSVTNADLRNNIVVNTSNFVAPARSVALRRQSATLTGYNALSNNNVYYTGSIVTNQNALYFDGTNVDTTLDMLKGRLAPSESNSISAEVPFVNDITQPYDLHINPAVATRIESGASVIASVTQDYDGDARSTTTPDIGADEGAFTALAGDFAGPQFTNVSISPNTYQCNAVPHLITATITDASGVASASILWSVDGVARTPIAMTRGAANVWTGTIPAQYFTNKSVRVSWNLGASDSVLIPNSNTYLGGSYKDADLYIDAGYVGNDTVNAGATIAFNAKATPTLVSAGVGTNTSDLYATPFYRGWGGNKRQFLYRASELSAGGLPAGGINSMTFQVFTALTQTPMPGFRVYIDSTTATATTATYLPYTNQVFGPVSYTAVTGDNTFTFANPFVWNGTSNIIVTICWSDQTTGGGTTLYVKTKSTAYTSTTYNNIDSQTPAAVCATASGSTNSTRPDILFGYTPSRTYAWSGTSSNILSATNILNPSATIPVAGNYQFIITVNDGTCSNSDTVSLVALTPQAPVAAFVANDDSVAIGGNPQTVTFTDQSTNVPDKWKWEFTPNNVVFMNGTNDSVQNPQVQFTSSGPFTVKLRASNAGGFDDSIRTNYIRTYVTYCPASPTSNAYEDIGNVRITDTLTKVVLLNNGIDTPFINRADANKLYTNFADSANVAIPSLYKGHVYNLGVGITWITSRWTNKVTAYIDYNKNGSFDDPGELVDLGLVGTTGTNRTSVNFTVPCNADTGIVRMRILASETSTTTPLASCTPPGSITWGEVEDYNIRILPTTLTYNSSDADQSILTDLEPGTNTRNIISVKVAAAGCDGALKATNFLFNTTGTTNLADISNAKLWYTGNSKVFAATQQVGSTTAPAASFTINPNVDLLADTNYFWLTFDITSNATLGNFVDAECTSITIGGSTYTPNNSAPSGSRKINFPSTIVAQSAVQVTGNVERNSNNNPIVEGHIEMTPVGAQVSLSDIKVALTGTTRKADLKDVKIWFGAANKNINQSIQFDTTRTILSDTMTFADTVSLALDTNYFWITASIKDTAKINNFVDAEIISYRVNGVLNTPLNANPAGNRKIVAPYCNATATSTADEDIGLFQFGSFVNGVDTPLASNPNSTAMYTNFTNLTGLSANIAVPTTMRVAVINSGSTLYGASTNVFIDYNQNGTFDLPQERVFKALHPSGNAALRTAIDTITIPVGTPTGKTRLRVMTQETSTVDLNPCLNFSWGEVEDYTIEILPPPPGDYYPPTISNIVNVQGDSSCVVVAHDIRVTVFDTTGVASVTLNWAIDNITQAPIVMTATTGGVYTAQIPASGASSVSYSFTVVDNSVNANTATYPGGNYRDAVLVTRINKTPDGFIGAGGSYQLNAVTTQSKSIGTGTTNSTTGLSPLSQFYEGQRTQYLVSASIMHAAGYQAGLITSVGYNVLSGFQSMPFENYTIKIGSTSAAALTAGTFETTPMTTVYGPVQLPQVTAAGIVSFSFNTPFVWDGTSNILLEVCFDNDPGGLGIKYSSTSSVEAMNTSYLSVNGRYADNTAMCGTTNGSSTTGSALPSFRFSQPISVTYSWSQPANGGLSATNIYNPVATPTGGVGTYQYVVTVNDGKCNATDTVVVNVVAPPTVNLGADRQVCSGQSIILDAGNPGATYSWSTGATTQTINVVLGATYTVAVTNQAGLIGRDTIVITQVASPIFDLGADQQICAGQSVTLNAGNPGSTYLWSTGATTQSITVTDSGKYVVSVTNSNNCTVVDSIVISVTPSPVVSLGADQAICPGGTVTLDAGNAGSTYLWSTGATTQTITVNALGNYSVAVTNANGCIGRDTVSVISKPLPTVNAGPDLSKCPGDSVTINAGAGFAAYLWNTGATTQSIRVSAAAQYIVTVTNAEGCSASDTVNVTNNALPVVNLGNDRSICTSDTITLDAGNVGSTYLWSTGATTRTIRVSAAGTYSVNVTNTSGCSASDAIVITNLPAPNATFTGQAVDTARGQQVQFNSVVVAGNAYSWNFGDPTSPTNTSLQPNPIHIFTTPGTYTVTLTVTNVSTGCISVEKKTISVTTVGNNFAKIFNLHAAPNPFVGNTKIKYTLPEDAKNVSIEVFDMLGRKITTIAKEENQMANSYEFDFNNSDVETNSGMYLVKLIVDGKQAITRVIDIAKR